VKSDQKLKTQHQKPITVKAQLRKAKTLDDLFAQDKINEILNELNETKTNITDIVVFYRTFDNYYHARDNDLPKVKLLGLVEFCKDLVLHPENNEDDED
jgi:3-methyladenine DNA glycosylase AlkC